MAPFAYLDHPGPIPLVHRAAGGEHAENTLPAIQAAVRLGFRYVETDVRTTADGVSVLAHDADLSRVAGARTRVADLLARDLERVGVGAGGLARLDAVLDALPDVRLNVDLKDEAGPSAVTSALTATGAWDRVCVTSFSDRRVDAFRRLVPRPVCTGMGTRRSAALVASRRAAGRLGGLASRLDRAVAPAAVAQLPVRWGVVPVVDRALVDHAHALGIPVHVWTVNTRPEMQRLLDLGVDGIVTDAPLVLRAVLQERGQWAG
jgi:glycerophosphoryl diester phosphodiesterase